MAEHRVLFDRGPLGTGSAFRAPVALIRADHPDEVPEALAALDRAHAAGHWLAGYAGYELGYLFSARLRDLMPEARATPLLQFGVFAAPTPYTPPDRPQPATLSPPEPLWSFADYAVAFAEIKARIAAGDVYQANLTFPMRARATGPVEALYARLRARQPVPHGALVALGGPAILSRSPELFFARDADGGLTARPMKGTMPRGETPEADAANAAWLRASEKNQAENLMIVDLLRNDISRVAEIGSVKVPELFAIESYATLHQMTSRITAQSRPGTTLSALFEALFPCGSVTGAPKIAAMTLLSRLERGARDAYCGSIGWVAPDGRMEFNVAIRTLICDDDGTVRLDVGGGIVHDSSAEEEYAEALLKARFADLA